VVKSEREQKGKKVKAHRNLRFFYEGDFNVNLTRKITYLYVEMFPSHSSQHTTIFNPHKNVQFICDLWQP
jgi:hypothetical protein